MRLELSKPVSIGAGNPCALQGTVETRMFPSVTDGLCQLYQEWDVTLDLTQDWPDLNPHAIWALDVERSRPGSSCIEACGSGMTSIKHAPGSCAVKKATTAASTPCSDLGSLGPCTTFSGDQVTFLATIPSGASVNRSPHINTPYIRFRNTWAPSPPARTNIAPDW